ncbi:FecR family protein [Pedobacter zeae]|uniref:Ferric-dicitrate binding protein FerR (Iron transport regulator) n=1 Tax=Pedobacter zeae TaxID=1737356 RepID=A0A7W6K8P7_9SPHI|nr:FecR family protein [Pedobacter zeae]MBB4107253.1 ferric-dicitrate binding protein FerR (iron transport regulator) [Pedobacter zeae]GGH06687.1 iron dicitrate transporter FecR [Pedobacter zeae]
MEKNAKKLLNKYIAGNCTPEEMAVIEEWYLHLPVDQQAPPHSRIESSKQEVWNRLSLRTTTLKRLTVKRFTMAASIVLCLGVGLYFVAQRDATPLTAKTELKNILPGGHKAVLTLADGTVVNLDDAKNGQIANQSGVVIRKAKNGQLEYIVTELANAAVRGSNTIATPRGGQYQVNLPDGTKVWLNAATTLTYPYAFAKKERQVELSGEAYFEVAKDHTRPFRVKTGAQTVEVLGTHFNINAYRDEAMVKTTLLEGAVKVSTQSGSVNLHPGEQSQFNANNARLSLNEQVDTDKEMAWKNNIFSFDNDDLQSIMRQISRWYDVDVVYQGKITSEKYIGEIPRNSNLEEVFKILELNHVHIDARGKVLTVTGN